MFMKLVFVLQFGMLFSAGLQSGSAVSSTHSDISETSLNIPKSILLRQDQNSLNTDNKKDINTKTTSETLITFPTSDHVLKNVTVLENLNKNSNLKENDTAKALSTFPTKGYVKKDLSLLRNSNEPINTSTVPMLFPNDNEKFNIVDKNKTIINLLNHNVSSLNDDDEKDIKSTIASVVSEQGDSNHILETNQAKNGSKNSLSNNTNTDVTSKNISISEEENSKKTDLIPEHINSSTSSKSTTIQIRNPEELFPTDSTKFTIIDTNDNLVKNLTHETTDSEVSDLNSNENTDGEYEVDQEKPETEKSNIIDSEQPDDDAELFPNDNEDKKNTKNETRSNHEQPENKPKVAKGEIVEILVSVFVMVAVFGYISLIIWRKSLEYRYGNRELLVNEEEYSRYDTRFEL